MSGTTLIKNIIDLRAKLQRNMVPLGTLFVGQTVFDAIKDYTVPTRFMGFRIVLLSSLEPEEIQHESERISRKNTHSQ